MASGPLTMISVNELSRNRGRMGCRGDTEGSGAAARVAVGGARITALVSRLPQWMTIRRMAHSGLADDDELAGDIPARPVRALRHVLARVEGAHPTPTFHRPAEWRCRRARRVQPN